MTTFMTVIVICLIILYIADQLCDIYAPQIKGYWGEKRVAKILDSLPKEQYRVINNVLIKKGDNETAQIDHIVISNYGIFSIETKNYKGLITGSEFAQQWTKYMGKKKYKFQNPIRQNYGHIKALEKALELKKDNIISLIVFAQGAKLKVSCKTPVVNNSSLNKTIKSYQDQKFSAEQVDTIVNKINALNIYTKQAMREHVKQVKKKQRQD